MDPCLPPKLLSYSIYMTKTIWEEREMKQNNNQKKTQAK